MKRWVWVLSGVVVLIAALVVASFALEGPLRSRIEAEMNERLTGYSVAIRAVDLHPLGFGLDLEGLVISQRAKPEPPVMNIPAIRASVQWGALLRGRVVSDFEIVRPILHIDRAQLAQEAKDDTALHERGWQHALQAAFPFKLNELRVTDADIVYIDGPKARPLELNDFNAIATNIRNIDSPDRTYPSRLHVDSRVFDKGSLVIDGNADFLAEPHPGLAGDVKVTGVRLDYFDPIAARYNVDVRQGSVNAEGTFEVAPTIKRAHLKDVQIAGVKADFIHTARTAGREKKMARDTKEAAKEVANRPGVLLRIDRLRITGGTLGWVNRAEDPDYRVFFAGTNLVVTNLSNQRREGTMTAKGEARFMGSGSMTLSAAFRPELKGADFDLDVRILNTDLRAMNDMLRAHGGFDVVGGTFSLYSELAVKNGRVNGYVKPLFSDVNAYDPRQDKEKGPFKKLYEKVVEGVADILENPARDEVATKADISGPLESPDSSTFEIVMRLIQNAFIKAILPGFEREADRS